MAKRLSRFETALACVLAPCLTAARDLRDIVLRRAPWKPGDFTVLNGVQAPDTAFDCTDDARTSNNTMRHQYRALSPIEKQQMAKIKRLGDELYQTLDAINRSEYGPDQDVYWSLEIQIACQRVEEAVMWGCKHITR